MKFVDEAKISVSAGNGGAGCLSFRREKFIPRGGPDGGDGGDGGSVYLQADDSLNTLVDYRYQRQYKAGNGEPGRGSNCRGRSGEDEVLRVPVGTTVIDDETEEEIGDLLTDGDQLLVAQGGFHGLGNTRFKSSVNRAPRETSPGTAGESRKLKLELKLIADVGLLGLPNAGKSTLISQISAAKPKIADYPFTTLTPNLGVVKVDPTRSFVVADIPGLIEGASQGQGLGVRFLKHLTRNRVLLHLVDVVPIDGSDPVQNALSIVNELKSFSDKLSQRERWLVLNKIDLLVPEEVEAVKLRLLEALGNDQPVYSVSAVTGEGSDLLIQNVMTRLEEIRETYLNDTDAQLAEETFQKEMQREARQKIEELSLARKQQRKAMRDQSDDDDYDVDVVYLNE